MLWRLKIAVLVLTLALLASCGGQSAKTASPPPPPAANAPGTPVYVLGAGDSLTISVWKFDDLKRTVQVDPSGDIIFPLAGRVQAAGMTPDQLRQDLTAKLSKYYVDPVVDVSITSLRSAAVHVLGEVKSPGTFTLDKQMLAQEAIAKAGGFATSADENKVILVRSDREAARVYVLSLSLQGLEEGASDYRLVLLSNNDILYVPPDKITDTARFLQKLEAVITPFITLGRGIIIGDQVYKVFHATGSAGIVVAP